MGPRPGFRAPEWREQPWFAHLARAYDLNARWLGRIVEALEVEPRLKRRLRFFARQYADALAPANFPHTNPEVLRLAAETRGKSLSRGLRNLVADLDRGRISMTDESAFTVGGNLAVTPGAVVFENEYFQLLRSLGGDPDPLVAQVVRSALNDEETGRS